MEKFKSLQNIEKSNHKHISENLRFLEQNNHLVSFLIPLVASFDTEK